MKQPVCSIHAGDPLILRMRRRRRGLVEGRSRRTEWEEMIKGRDDGKWQLHRQETESFLISLSWLGPALGTGSKRCTLLSFVALVCIGSLTETVVASFPLSSSCTFILEKYTEE